MKIVSNRFNRVEIVLLLLVAMCFLIAYYIWINGNNLYKEFIASLLIGIGSGILASFITIYLYEIHAERNTRKFLEKYVCGEWMRLIFNQYEGNISIPELEGSKVSINYWQDGNVKIRTSYAFRGDASAVVQFDKVLLVGSGALFLSDNTESDPEGVNDDSRKLNFGVYTIYVEPENYGILRVEMKAILPNPADSGYEIWQRCV